MTRFSLNGYSQTISVADGSGFELANHHFLCSFTFADLIALLSESQGSCFGFASTGSWEALSLCSEFISSSAAFDVLDAGPGNQMG